MCMLLFKSFTSRFHSYSNPINEAAIIQTYLFRPAVITNSNLNN